MKILIVSDSHDNYGKLQEAISVGNEAGCGVMLHAGDFVSPLGIDFLKDFGGEVHMVFGNCEGEKVRMISKIAKYENITMHGDVMEKEFAGLKFYMNHYPDIVKNASLTNKYHICIHGHSHIYNEEKISEKTTILNPGEIQGYKTGMYTCMIFDTKTKKVEKINL